MDALAKPEITSFLSVGPLPEGLKVLLRIVAEGEWRDVSTEHVYAKNSAEIVRTASAAFLTTVLFGRKTDPYRVLGLPPGASLSEVREHKRLLLKWLHPDRNPQARDQVYLARVIEAAEAIEGGRNHNADDKAGPSPSDPRAVRPKDGGAAKKRSATSGTKRGPWSVARAARQALAGSMPGLLRTARVSALALTGLLVSLVIWRYLMDEPIGASIARYAELALGIAAWP
jgi:hypothetical protein